MRDPQRQTVSCAIRASTASQEAIQPDACSRGHLSVEGVADRAVEAPVPAGVAAARAVSDQLQDLADDIPQLYQHMGVHEGPEGACPIEGKRQAVVNLSEPLSLFARVRRGETGGAGTWGHGSGSFLARRPGGCNPSGRLVDASRIRLVDCDINIALQLCLADIC